MWNGNHLFEFVLIESFFHRLNIWKNDSINKNSNKWFPFHILFILHMIYHFINISDSYFEISFPDSKISKVEIIIDFILI